MVSKIAAIDQGTTSSRCLIFDEDGTVLGSDQREHEQITPNPGWVSHDADEIWQNTRAVIENSLRNAGVRGADLSAVGITNQRETTVAWDAEQGALAPALVWQDTRTQEICDRLHAESDSIRQLTGLPVATYFSAPKMRWLLENESAVREARELRFGTIDSWLIWNLTGGPSGGVHATDVTNASRTLLCDLESANWNDDLCARFDVPASSLPEVRPSVAHFGTTRADGPFGAEIPITGVLGDQQAAAFGQGCFESGDCKNTYGTGCFLLQNTGAEIRRSNHGLLTTIAYAVEGSPVQYALEGSIAVTGSLVQWLRDRLQIIGSAAEVEAVARSVEDCGDVYLVPAFSGLFAPHWRPDARGVIVGLSLHSERGHICRASLESTAFQTRELVDALAADSGNSLGCLRVDGGMVRNDLLMQIQADTLGIPIVRPSNLETTAVGAAAAAGLGANVHPSLDSLRARVDEAARWEPDPSSPLRTRGFRQWQRAVERSLNWVE